MSLLNFLRPRRETIFVPAAPTVRSGIERQTKAIVWSMTNGRCYYCGVQTNPFRDFAIDHVMPIHRGGRDSLDNMVPCCAPCNRRKSDQLPGDWIASLNGGAWYQHQPWAIKQRASALGRTERS
jgi:5-methylcytosine-specific restriction endonuclease McrA